METVMEECFPEELAAYTDEKESRAAKCPKFNVVMNKLKKTMAASTEGCVVKALGWVNAKWVPDMEEHDSDIMSLDPLLTAKLDKDAIKKCASKLICFTQFFLIRYFL